MLFRGLPGAGVDYRQHQVLSQLMKSVVRRGRLGGVTGLCCEWVNELMDGNVVPLKG